MLRKLRGCMSVLQASCRCPNTRLPTCAMTRLLSPTCDIVEAGHLDACMRRCLTHTPINTPTRCPPPGTGPLEGTPRWLTAITRILQLRALTPSSSVGKRIRDARIRSVLRMCACARVVVRACMNAWHGDMSLKQGIGQRRNRARKGITTARMALGGVLLQQTTIPTQGRVRERA